MNKLKKEDKVTVVTICCPLCSDIIYSRCRHDFRYCSCKAIFIDGGLDYTRYGGSKEVPTNTLRTKRKNIDVTKQELYDDWNLSKDKFGKITVQNK